MGGGRSGVEKKKEKDKGKKNSTSLSLGKSVSAKSFITQGLPARNPLGSESLPLRQCFPCFQHLPAPQVNLPEIKVQVTSRDTARLNLPRPCYLSSPLPRWPGGNRSLVPVRGKVHISPTYELGRKKPP